MAKAFHLSSRKGFTLIEIVITVLIMGAITALAVPAFLGARDRSQAKTCSGQLRQIKYSKEAWAMDNKQQVTSVARWDDLYPAYMKDMPECPGGGEYTIRAINQDPICSVGGTHVLQ